MGPGKSKNKKNEKKDSVGKTAGDKSYYNLQRAKDLAKKDGHDYDKLPQYDRTHDKHKDHYDSKAKKESVKSESKEISSFDSSCFSGKYITGNVDKEYLTALDKLRNDAEKIKTSQEEQTFDEVVVY